MRVERADKILIHRHQPVFGSLISGDSIKVFVNTVKNTNIDTC